MFVQADDTFKKLLDQNFATAVLLSDSDAISLGFHDFDAWGQPREYGSVG